MWVRTAIGAGLAHSGVAVEHRLDFFGKHLAPGQIDNRRFPSNQKQESIRIDAPNVSGVEPAVAEHSLAWQPWRGIAVKYAWPADGDFPAATAIGYDDSNSKILQRTPDRIPPAQWIIRI